jgi:transposase InsO family protein
MEEKLRFVLEYQRDELTMTELCEQFGVSRETGYVWLRRYRQSGVPGLLEVNRAPHRRPNQTPAEMERALIELRQAHMTWGPRKLKRVLSVREPGRVWPAQSTIGALLKREGLVIARRKRRKTAPYDEPLAHADGANRVWCADYKGWFRTRDGSVIYPLTITDAFSRYVLRCQQVVKTDTERARAVFEAAFREYGLPQAIRTDNGAPFASLALAGLSQLSVWWIKLGIVPERIEPGKPQQNGRHERMHRTLKQDTAMPPSADRGAQQRAFDEWVKTYNEVRPHEALGMQVPAAVYEPSAREYPRRVPEPEYPDTMLQRTVHSHGHFRWKQRHDVFLSEVLWGERVGLLPIDDRWYEIYFCQVPIGRFDSQRLKVEPLPRTRKRSASGEGGSPPSPEPQTTRKEEKVSGMCPV